MTSHVPRKAPRHRRWVSTRRRLLASLGVTLPPEFNPELDSPIWGADAIGEAINKTEQATFRLLYAGILDADQVSTVREIA